MNANRVYRCSRCKTRLRTQWKAPTRECPCGGVLRHVNVREERQVAKAKRELAEVGA
jgi:DNA-directed RNA polymerase subunit RPC12/RpoP